MEIDSHDPHAVSYTAKVMPFVNETITVATNRVLEQLERWHRNALLIRGTLLCLIITSSLIISIIYGLLRGFLFVLSLLLLYWHWLLLCIYVLKKLPKWLKPSQHYLMDPLFSIILREPLPSPNMVHERMSRYFVACLDYMTDRGIMFEKLRRQISTYIIYLWKRRFIESLQYPSFWDVLYYGSNKKESF